MKEKKILVTTGGGDCPGLNAVIRGIVKRAQYEGGWRVFGSIESFNGVLKDKAEIVELTPELVSGIHVKGGTIIKTTNRGGPFKFPVKQPDGTWIMEDRSLFLKERLEKMGFDAVINIGGDGSQRISLGLHEMGIPIVGVPKTIDNDLSMTDVTFGFQTAVQFATEALDRLVTTAESHNRIFILEVMGRDAGWIALHTAVAGGAEVCIIPEILYDPRKIVEKIETRYNQNEGFCNIVIAEGAKSLDGKITGKEPTAIGDRHFKLGGVGEKLKCELEQLGVEHDIRVMVLGHLQRGGTPTAYDRVLATQFGVKAFELVKEGTFGKMVTFYRDTISSVSLEKALEKPNLVKPTKEYLVHAAKKIGIVFGD
ncbi:MAG TPA: ATP-dependent 6-phosphofructokinase [Bacteroidales bacterium]|nr:ATP-dependent 6-phosphofructokinase [Bacteroidales bacterium]HRR04289.1 ATP-dependent 6-phosphofructokinase [Bacteroidales bacterium]HRT13969.1 ATP-dependent 6-phosphofructokinase [Bacteroidales bacterium]HXK74157.1 ATP-dependent 6-phosphofructokinase [Bacteroidales bacterium]